MIQFNAIEYVAGKWKYTWPSGLGKVRLVLWGEEISTTESDSFSFMPADYVSEIEPPPLEIVPENSFAESEINLCRLTFQWYRQDCISYLLEYKLGTYWVFAASIQDDPLIFLQTYTTGILEDMKKTEWRLRAMDKNKRLGPPLQFEWFMVRPPNPPAGLKFSCSNGLLTIE